MNELKPVLLLLLSDKMYRSNRGYPGPGGFMGHETLEESNQQMEGELKEKIQRILIFIAWQPILSVI